MKRVYWMKNQTKKTLHLNLASTIIVQIFPIKTKIQKLKALILILLSLAIVGMIEAEIGIGIIDVTEVEKGIISGTEAEIGMIGGIEVEIETKGVTEAEVGILSGIEVEIETTGVVEVEIKINKSVITNEPRESCTCAERRYL